MKRILIVEDDELAAAFERDYLVAGGFEVDIAPDGAEGLKLALAGEYALVVLDVMLPGMSGFDVCRELRRERDVPIVMVTARQEDVDKVRGLGLGADDYVAKPFSPAELVARCKAHIAMHERLAGSPRQDGDGVIRSGDLAIDAARRTVTVRGGAVELANREFELLHFLASSPGIVFSKEALFERVWGMDALGRTDTVAVHVNRIREKVEADPSRPAHILTVRGAGYKFV